MVGTRIYAVAGAKGGVGKTTTSINLATAVATRGASTVVVELDLAMANLVDFLELDVGLDDAPTVHDVLAGRAAVGDAVRSAPGGLDVVPSGVDLDGFQAADVERLPALLGPLVDEYDRIVLDTGAGLSRETVVPLGLADEVILVSTPRVAAVRDVEKTARLAERVDTGLAGIVFTKSGTGRAPPPPELADFLDVELLGHVPEDPAVPASQDVGRPAVVHASDSEAATAYQRIATTLDKRAVRAAADGERSLELPRLDGIDDRTAAEGPAATGTDATAAAPGTDGGGTEPDGWQFGGDDRGPETAPAATPTGIENRDGRAPAAATDEGTGDAAASDGGTVGAAVAEGPPAAPDSNPAPSGAVEERSDTADEEGSDGAVEEASGEPVAAESDDAGGSLADRARSLLGL